MSLPLNVSLMIGRRHLQRFLLAIGKVKPMTSDLGEKLGDHFVGKFGDLGDKMKALENARILVLSLLETELWGIFEMILCDVTSHRIRYKYLEVPKRILTSLEFVRRALVLFGVLSAVRAGKLIEAERFRKCCCCYY
ncbi:hypothetical protein AVEN_85970-1 [Araneus ventricosus]|uniref:Uncharacterized protein n=1 Tax=Araneus ventricosus TaxID=182803 RepID=A0A4Y2G7H1_ARAVE|nr:hypothetical protein AVEN_85970-1 [Araneus ventricosus]